MEREGGREGGREREWQGVIWIKLGRIGRSESPTRLNWRERGGVGGGGGVCMCVCVLFARLTLGNVWTVQLSIRYEREPSCPTQIKKRTPPTRSSVAFNPQLKRWAPLETQRRNRRTHTHTHKSGYIFLFKFKMWHSKTYTMLPVDP